MRAYCAVIALFAALPKCRYSDCVGVLLQIAPHSPAPNSLLTSRWDYFCDLHIGARSLPLAAPACNSREWARAGGEMNELLQASSAVIATWLEARLLTLGANWWQEHVVSRLTFQQQRQVEERCIRRLTGLDLAAILRVLDQNWNELAAMTPLPREARNWVKELQSTRNRWAHAPAGGVAATPAFRDADTLERLLTVVGASRDLIESLSTFKAETLERLAPKTERKELPTAIADEAVGSDPSTTSVNLQSAARKFTLGQLVCLRSNQAVVFPVLDVLAGGSAETRYRVFENGARQVYYESQLQALEEPEADFKTLTATELSSLLSAAQLSSPSASALYSLNSGRVRFVPYQ